MGVIRRYHKIGFSMKQTYRCECWAVGSPWGVINVHEANIRCECWAVGSPWGVMYMKQTSGVTVRSPWGAIS